MRDNGQHNKVRAIEEGSLSTWLWKRRKAYIAIQEDETDYDEIEAIERRKAVMAEVKRRRSGSDYGAN
jgi:hypothetical protein